MTRRPPTPAEQRAYDRAFVGYDDSVPEARAWWDGLSERHRDQVVLWLRQPPPAEWQTTPLDYAWVEMIQPGSLLSFLNRL